MEWAKEQMSPSFINICSFYLFFSPSRAPRLSCNLLLLTSFLLYEILLLLRAGKPTPVCLHNLKSVALKKKRRRRRSLLLFSLHVSPFLLKMTQNVSNYELVPAGVLAARESAGFTDPSTCTAVIFDLYPKPRLEASSEPDKCESLCLTARALFLWSAVLPRTPAVCRAFTLESMSACRVEERRQLNWNQCRDGETERTASILGGVSSNPSPRLFSLLRKSSRSVLCLKFCPENFLSDHNLLERIRQVPNRLNRCCLTVSSHLMSAGATASLESEDLHLKVVSITSGALVMCWLERLTMRGKKIARPALLTGSHQFYYSSPLLWCLTLTSHMPSVNPHAEK